jgi:hypothetical protein
MVGRVRLGLSTRARSMVRPKPNIINRATMLHDHMIGPQHG